MHQGAGQIAEILGNKTLFRINGLRHYDKCMTVKSGLRALAGGLVEFSTRAGIGFADD
jgi:hypothetical protein